MAVCIFPAARDSLIPSRVYNQGASAFKVDYQPIEVGEFCFCIYRLKQITRLFWLSWKLTLEKCADWCQPLAKELVADFFSKVFGTLSIEPQINLKVTDFSLANTQFPVRKRSIPFL